MKNVISNILDKAKENEKNLLIKSSGSLPENKNEKIRSGQCYLYKKNGMESEVIEVRFKKNISGSFLNQALQTTIIRYPYFNTKIIEKDGDFYLVQNNIALFAKKTKKLPQLGYIGNCYHLIDVTYHANSIYVSFHHALCDGRGIKPFVETLIYYYCQYKYNNNEKIEGIRLSKDKLYEDETKEPFSKMFEYDSSKEFVQVPKDGFAIPENKITDVDLNYRYEIKIAKNDYMNVCKNNNATPVILLSLLVNKAIAKLYPEYDKPILANIAADIRKQLGCENTFKNCVKSFILPYDKEFANKLLYDQATEYRNLLNLQRDEDYCKKEANNIVGLFDKLDSIAGFEGKQKMMSFFDTMLLNTYIISYLGDFNLESNKEYIDSIHLYNSGTTGLGITMVSCGEYFIINFKQSFESNKYVEAFLAELDNLKINYINSEKIEFSTPNDKIMKRKNK